MLIGVHSETRSYLNLLADAVQYSCAIRLTPWLSEGRGVKLMIRQAYEQTPFCRCAGAAE